MFYLRLQQTEFRDCPLARHRVLADDLGGCRPRLHRPNSQASRKIRQEPTPSRVPSSVGSRGRRRMPRRESIINQRRMWLCVCVCVHACVCVRVCVCVWRCISMACVSTHVYVNGVCKCACVCQCEFERIRPLMSCDPLLDDLPSNLQAHPQDI